MYTDVEVVENVNEDFLSALALLHSSDEGSAERLRNMLLASMEKKSVENSSRLVDNESDNSSAKSTGIVGQFDDRISDDFKDSTSSFSSSESTVDRSSLSSPSEIFTTDDFHDDEDIPRISIPDETTGDGVVCKICNGDKLGPLILLECQECQDVYHPLCHHPPVVDVDVYDPRIVWRCESCVGTFDETAGTFAVSHDDEIDGSRKKTNTTGSRVGAMLEPTRCSKEKFGQKQVTSSCFGRTRLRLENHGSPLKRITGLTHKNSSLKLPKRIGSRLSVARPSPAK